MKVSVILPTYNRAYILPEAVDSVISQTYTDWELIIVDDGSTDGTVGLVSGISDPRLRLVRHQRNEGYAAGLNTGLEHAAGDLIGFLDSDDLWMREKLEAQVAFLDEHPEAGGVFSDMVWVRGTQRVQSMLRLYPRFSRTIREGHRQGSTVFPQSEIYSCLLEEMPVKLLATVFRRKAVSQIGNFREDWQSGQDWEFLLRFTRVYALGYLDHPLAVVRTLSDSLLARRQKDDALSLMERFIEEKRQILRGSEALAAVRRGIAHHAKELGSCYLDEGEWRSAFRAYSRGFAHSGDPKLLARCAGAVLPRGTRELVRRVHKGMRNGR